MWIETFTGIAFPVKEVRPELINIDDIAHALSMVCRYAGHCRRFYSVAEHSCHVHDVIASDETSKDHSLAALLHDASEAYIGDVTRPLKVCLPDYREIEKRLQSTIYERFEAVLTDCGLRVIKRADNMVLKAEAEQLMFSQGALWDFGDIEAASVAVGCWSPDRAEREFRERFYIYR